MLIAGCGLLGALLVSFKRDFRLLIQLGVVFLLFMSGIFWDLNVIADTRLREGLLVLNPLANLIDCYRQVLMLGEAPNGMRLAWVLGESLLLLIIVWAAYSRLQFWIARQVVIR
jgi:lipopolysaccharide transport system permease protein